LHVDRRIREAQKHVDPVDPDPDPQHWLYCLFSGGMTELGCDSIDKLKAKLHSLDKGNIYIQQTPAT
jgi:hypothetical protein